MNLDEMIMRKRMCADWPPITDERIEQIRNEWREIGKRERRMRLVKTYLGLATTIVAVFVFGGWL